MRSPVREIVPDKLMEIVYYKRNENIVFHHNIINADFPTHWHTAVEIIYPIENSYTVIVEREKYVLNKKDILIIASGEFHEIIAPDTGNRIIFQFEFPEPNEDTHFNEIDVVMLHTQHITPKNSPEIYSIIQSNILQIFHEYKHKEELYDFAINLNILNIILAIARKYIKDFPIAQDQQENIKSYKQLIHSLNYINKNYINDITLDEVADVAGFSKYHFSRIFKQFTNQNFSAYLTRRRIRAVETQLVETNLPITNIAINNGFNSLATFNRVFKKTKGCTPSEFRKIYHL